MPIRGTVQDREHTKKKSTKCYQQRVFPTLIVPDDDTPSLEIITVINREHQRQRKEAKDKKRAT